MKKLLLLAMLMCGCATNAEKATAYCDDNWQGRYESWQGCYDRQFPIQNRGLRAFGAIFTGAGQGLQNVKRDTKN